MVNLVNPSVYPKIDFWILTCCTGSEDIGDTRPISLKNIGANCYLNAALQGISACEIFVDDIGSMQQNFKELEKLAMFNELLLILTGTLSGGIDISKNNIFKNWNNPGQQDSFELLSYVLNQVYNEIRQKMEQKKELNERDMQDWLNINLPMRIVIEYGIRCSCSKEIVKIPLQSDLALHVTIPIQGSTNMNLQDLIDHFFDEDQIVDYECSTPDCDGKNTIRQTKLLLPLPKTLCVHLQRTFWNGRKMVKINNKINFTNNLIIKSKFCSQQLDDAIDQNQMSTYGSMRSILSTRSFIKTNKDFSEYIDEFHFKLRAVIEHHGSVNGGHYICYKIVDNNWFLTNDSKIQNVEESAVLNCKAYILFYDKN